MGVASFLHHIYSIALLSAYNDPPSFIAYADSLDSHRPDHSMSIIRVKTLLRQPVTIAAVCIIILAWRFGADKQQRQHTRKMHIQSIPMCQWLTGICSDNSQV